MSFAATCMGVEIIILSEVRQKKDKYMISLIWGIWATLVAQMVKNPPAMWEAWVQSLGWEDPLEEEMAPSPVYLPGESPWTEEPGRIQFMGSQRVRHD